MKTMEKVGDKKESSRTNLLAKLRSVLECQAVRDDTRMRWIGSYDPVRKAKISVGCSDRRSKGK